MSLKALLESGLFFVEDFPFAANSNVERSFADTVSCSCLFFMRLGVILFVAIRSKVVIRRGPRDAKRQDSPWSWRHYTFIDGFARSHQEVAIQRNNQPRRTRAHINIIPSQ